jgi:hypothetical protein
MVAFEYRPTARSPCERKRELSFGFGSVRLGRWGTYKVSLDGLSGSDLLRRGEHEGATAAQGLDLSGYLGARSPSKDDTSGEGVVDEWLHLLAGW